jgi:DNA helicase HerA-like ATPase
LTIYFVVVYLLPLSGLIGPVSIPSKLTFEVIISIYPVLLGALLVRGKISSEQMMTAVIDDDLVSVHVGDYVIATCCLDIISAPGSVLVARNDRPEYATAFLLALRAGMDDKVSMAYEVGVWGGEVFLRIFITGLGKSMQEVGNTLRREATRTEAILLSSLNNVELQQLRGDDLSEAVSGILSLDLESGSELVSEEMHTALLLITGEPRVSPSLESSQIGTFISTSLRQGYNVSFTCVFSKAKPGREQRKLEGHWKTIREKEKRNEDSLADHSEKKKLLRNYEEIKGNAGWFDSSVSLAMRADTPDQLSSTQEGVAGVVQSIWGGESAIKLKQKSIGKRAVYKLLLRRHIASQRIHVSRLAAFLNTPVQQLPVITASLVPGFSIPSKEFVNNELIIGKAVFGGRRLNDVGLRPEWLREHVAVMGATGTGKTTLVKHLIAELSTKSSVPWWIFDIKGSEYQELVDLCDNDVLVLKPGTDPSFVIDFMDPEVDSGERHAHTTFAILKELLKERGVSSELSPAMEKLLREAVLEIARYSDNGNSIQALTQAVSELAGNDRTGTMTRDALLNRLEILSREPLGTILSGGREAIRISDLIDKRVILDLQHVARTGGMEAARLLYNLIAKRIFDCALHRGIRPGLHHLVVLEEASNLVPESYTRHTAADVTTGESMVMLQRATGQGVIIISTRPNVSSNILANTATKITFRLPYDSPIGARFMSLDEEQERYLKTLKRGRALIVLPGSEPFEIATQPFEMASVLKRPIESLRDDETRIEVESEDDRESSPEYDIVEAQSRRVSDSKPIGAVYDRLGELGSHVVAFLAARSMGTQAEIQGILTSIDPRIEGDDISEVIRDLVSLGTIEREALSLVPGDFIFTLPGKGLDAVRTAITDYIIEKLGLLDTTWERSSDEGPDIILDDRAILIIPQHLKASSMKTTLFKIRNYMNNLGNDVIELIVIVRGSVAAAKLREVMDETNEFDAVSIVSAFPSSIETMIENLVMGAPTNVDLTTNDDEMDQDTGVNLIGAMHDVGTATNRAIQMRLWFQLIQDFVDLSNGRTEWSVLLEFIETTALQSLKGKSTPMNAEEGKRALTELLADEVLMALRVGNDFDFIDLDEGLWIVNSAELGKLKDSAVNALEQELQKRQNSVSRNHGYYDLCTNGISYVVFPNQQQLNTLLHLQSNIACRTCKSERIVCVLTAAEYLEDTVVMPDNILLYDFSEYVSVASAAGHR